MRLNVPNCPQDWARPWIFEWYPPGLQCLLREWGLRKLCESSTVGERQLSKSGTPRSASWIVHPLFTSRNFQKAGTLRGLHGDVVFEKIAMTRSSSLRTCDQRPGMSSSWMQETGWKTGGFVWADRHACRCRPDIRSANRTHDVCCPFPPTGDSNLGRTAL